MLHLLSKHNIIKERDDEMNKIIKVNGMSCDHCVKRITNAVNEVEGAECLSVSLEDKAVSVEVLNDEVLKQVEDVIIDLGYDVVK